MKKYINHVFLIFGLLILLLSLISGVSPVLKMSLVALVIALWWIFEILPLYVTALIPVVMFPITGIMTAKEVAPIYMSPILLLFIGGFLVVPCRNGIFIKELP